MSVLGYGRDEMLAVFLGKLIAYLFYHRPMATRLGACLLSTSTNLTLRGTIVSQNFLCLLV